METNAKDLLATFSDRQRTKGLFRFDDQRRFEWSYYTNFERKGVPLRELTAEQLHLTYVLLAKTVGRSALEKALTIMSLENLVREMNGEGYTVRDPSMYFVSFFGEPNSHGSWGWSLEGHHVSVNATFYQGRLISLSPFFLGAQPHFITKGPREGLRVLACEEDRARELLQSFSESQLRKVIVSEEAPVDVLTGNDPRVNRPEARCGIPNTEMTPNQKHKLRALTEVYLERFPEPLLSRYRAAIANDLVTFEWRGSMRVGPGHLHYYSVATNELRIEFGNTFDEANHSHTVWRDYEGDFGESEMGNR